MPKVKDPQIDTNIGAQRPLPSLLTRYGERVQEELPSLLPQNDLELYQILRYHMGWVNQRGESLGTPEGQGKAIRPALCLFACQALEGDWDKALPAAAALELIHNFSLIHDDIQDGDIDRRHRPTVWYVWGQAKGVVAGNAMRCLGYQVAPRLVEKGILPEKALACSSLLVESCLSMIQGQYLDLAFEDNLNIGLDNYLEMIRLKTSSLITCSLEMGALLASNKASYVEAFARYGSHIGRVFQIRDDILGIWGKEQNTGKAAGNDIRRRKKSFPIVYSLERAQGSTRQELVSIYQKESPNEEEVNRVLAILEDTGAQDHAQALVMDEASLALENLEDVPLSSWARSEVEELVDFLVSRQY